MMKKLYGLLWVAFAFLVWVNPHPASAMRGGLTTGASQYGSNACGVSTNTWCFGTDGWTVFSGTPANAGSCGPGGTNAGTCIVAVTNAGVDATCAAQPLPSNFVAATFVPTAPCATPGKAQLLLRNNQPDWLLVKKGDSWPYGLNYNAIGFQNGAWNENGKSTAEPMLIGSYGTGARPLFFANGVDTSCLSSNTRAQNLAVIDIECYTDFMDPASGNYQGAVLNANTTAASATVTVASTTGIANGMHAFGSGINNLTVASFVANTSITFSGGTAGFTSSSPAPVQFNATATQASVAIVAPTFFLMENVKIRFNGVGVPSAVSLVATNIILRRNIIVDGWNPLGSGPIVFINDNPISPSSILIEENLTDHLGWNSSLWGGCGNVFSHNYYIHDWNPSVSANRNISSNASATGFQFRNGGNLYNNLGIKNPISAGSPESGVNLQSNSYTYNVFADNADLTVGIRLATKASTSGTTLFLDGITTSGNCGLFSLQRIVDLDNPGALVSTNGNAAGNGTNSVPVTISNSSPAVFGFTNSFVGNEQVSFSATGTSSVLPSGLTAGATYFVSTSGLSGSSFQVSATSGGASINTASAGVGSFFIGSADGHSIFITSSVQSGIRGNGVQVGDRLAFMAGRSEGASIASTVQFPPTTTYSIGTTSFTMPTAIPAWVSAGMTVGVSVGTAGTFPGANNTTTVAAGTGGTTLVTTDATLKSGVGNEQTYFTIYTTGNLTNVPSNTFGPNNVLTGSVSIGGCGFAVSPQAYTQGVLVTGNYFYNWCNPNTSNIIDFGLSGQNTTGSPTGAAFNYTPASPSQANPQASISAYDATLQNNNFTATITAALSVTGYFGATINVTGGTPPNNGDTILGTGVPQFTYAVSCSGVTCLVANQFNAISNQGSTAMTSGSASHFIAQARLQSHASWNTAYTAGAANNYIRNAIGCTAGSTPACPPQFYNYLLKRDLDPASNDNDPVWLKKAA